MDLKNYPKTLFLYPLITVGIILLTFVAGLGRSMNETVPGAVDRNLTQIAGAVSNYAYGLGGYMGYVSVQNSLYANGLGEAPEQLPALFSDRKAFQGFAAKADDTLKTAAHLPDAASRGVTSDAAEDVGNITFFTLAFKLFGLRIESFYYFYFLILTVSVLALLAAFWRRWELMLGLIILCCAHLVTAMALPAVGKELQTVFNSRFMGVLAAFPTFHLALLIMGYDAGRWDRFIFGILQACLLVFLLYVRVSTIYHALFLVSLTGILFLRRWLALRSGKPRLSTKPAVWPLLSFFVLFIFTQLHLMTALNYPYTSTTSKHFFWHPLYVGLSIHPDAFKKYGIVDGDMAGEKGSSQTYLGNLDAPDDLQQREIVLKNAFFHILKTDPLFVVQGYYYKLVQFLKMYFSFQYISLALFLFVLFLLLFLAGWGPLSTSGGFGKIFALESGMFIFSFFPILFVYPNPVYIMDTVFGCSLFLFGLISIAAMRIRTIGGKA